MLSQEGLRYSGHGQGHAMQAKGESKTAGAKGGRVCVCMYICGMYVCMCMYAAYPACRHGDGEEGKGGPLLQRTHSLCNRACTLHSVCTLGTRTLHTRRHFVSPHAAVALTHADASTCVLLDYSLDYSTWTANRRCGAVALASPAPRPPSTEHQPAMGGGRSLLGRPPPFAHPRPSPMGPLSAPRQGLQTTPSPLTTCTPTQAGLHAARPTRSRASRETLPAPNFSCTLDFACPQ